VKTYYDIVGDGGSNVAAQVKAQHERIAENLAGVRHLVAVGSGKGGVGKSTLAMQLAAAFRAEDAAVAILDADLNGPTQARLAGLRDVPPIPGAKGLALPRTASGIGVLSMGSFVPESRHLEFDSVSRGESHTWRATKEFAVLGELLATVDWGTLDFLVVDLPPGAERTSQFAELFGARAAFVLVTVPSDVARGVVARSVAALEDANARVLGYIENMRGYFCPECRSVKPLFPEARGVALDVPRLGEVPFDPEISAMCDEGRAASAAPSDDRPALRAMRTIAATIRERLGSS
jgi:ATP-binding protein involved in chromosome partitioning